MSEVQGNKVVLLGEAGVGKTSIISRYIKQKFDPEYITSLTSQYLRKSIKFPDNVEIILDIYDTSGQERYRSIAHIYYKNARAVILVYDITSTHSFEQMKEYWYKQIKEIDTENLIIAIVANKNDLYEERVIQDEEGEKFAEEIGAFFVSTSAKNDSGVKKLFIYIGRKILDPNYVLSKEEEDNIDNPKEEEKINEEYKDVEEDEEEEDDDSEGRKSRKTNKKIEKVSDNGKGKEKENKNVVNNINITKTQSFRLTTKTIKASSNKVKKKRCCK